MQFEEALNMKKKILRVLLLICGLNVFTACYGMPPGDWPQPVPTPENDEQTKSPVISSEDTPSAALNEEPD